MNAGPFAPLLADFAHNWVTHQPDLAVPIAGQQVELEDGHPLYGELVSLCSGNSASLPFFAKEKEVVWCTVAPDSDSLRRVVATLHAWVLPSLAGEGRDDGYVAANTPKGGLTSKIISVSPDGYYRWRCPRAKFPRVLEKLRLQRSLEAIRPPRTCPPRPSLYELRARFAAALLVGDRDGAEDIIDRLDSLQIETAVNTQFMRIRLWHHFRELDRIRQHPDLQHLLVQPLPPRVRDWILEALGQYTPPTYPSPPTTPQAEAEPPPPTQLTWVDWFGFVKRGEKAAAETFLQERPETCPADLSPTTVEALIANVEELYLDDALRTRVRAMVLQGVVELLEDFVRETAFPRATLGDFYLAMLRLWCVLHAGTAAGQEHAHVLLELAAAVLQLNRDPDAVRGLLEEWWRARPAPTQLPYALDAIELLERELPGTEATANLWLDAADFVRRAPESLTTSEKNLWRRIGGKLGIEEPTINAYLPLEDVRPVQDILQTAGLRKVAIVCMRERQAKEAAEMISQRSGALVAVVADKTAGPETEQALDADAVLFVWMASTHSVFRAFDGFDRKRFCYVQGTGAASIVRTLEKWACDNQVAVLARKDALNKLNR